MSETTMGPHPKSKYYCRKIDIKSLKTICGGIHFDLVRYNKKEIWKDHFENISGYLHINCDSVYGVDVSIDGFILFTRCLVLKFIHHDDASQRTVEVIHRAY
jgi:hypothetical protein